MLSCRKIFGIWCLVLGIFSQAYAQDLGKVKISFLEGDYKQAILEGEKLLGSDAHAGQSDELYYILALSYLKDGNYLRASDIFEIIIKEFKNSRFKEEARMGLGDAYFLCGDLTGAKKSYKELLDDRPQTNLKAQLYYRLSQVALKNGDTQEAKEYLGKLEKFPENPESLSDKELDYAADMLTDLYYTVQVGSFENLSRADNLVRKLNEAGYSAYREETVVKDRKIYRVRAGKFKQRKEAEDLEKRLSHEGYPTKIFP